jgi:PAS domain S-box-containing protein
MTKEMKSTKYLPFVGAVIVLVLGGIDYLSGTEISFSIFYLLPIYLVARYTRKKYGVLISVLSAITWLVADMAGDVQYSHAVIPVWNAIMRLGVFLLVTHYVAMLKELNEGLEQKIEERTTALRESEERYRLLFDRMMDGVYRSTHEGRFVEINDAMVKMFGYASKEEMLKVDIKKELYFAPEDRESLFLDTGQEKIEIFRMRRKDGSEIWVEDHGRYIHDEKGNVIFHEGILRDVTERVRAEDALLRSEANLRRAQQIGKIGRWYVDLEKNTLEWSEEVFKIFSQDSKTFIPTNEKFLELVHPDDRNIVRKTFEESISQGKRYEIEHRIILPDGSERVLYEQAEIVKDSQGKSVAMEGVVQDITERKQAEIAVRESEERFRLVAEQTGQLIYDYDIASGEIRWEGAIERLTGYQPQEFNTFNIHRWEEHIHPEDAPHAVQMLDESMKTHLPYHVEYRFRRKEGTYFTVEDNGIFLYNSNGNAYRMIGTMNDITERKRAEQLQNAVYRIAEAAGSSKTLNDLFREVHKIIGQVMSAGNFYIALYDAATESLSFPYFVDEVDLQPPTSGAVGKGLTAYVLRTGKSLLCDEKLSEHLARTGEAELVGSPSAIWLGVPLIVEGEPIGAMVVQDYANPKAYSETELQMLEFVSSEVARAIDRKRTEEKLHEREEQLRQAQKMESIGTLAGGVAHDFNNILGIILAYTSVLKQSKADEAKRQQSIETIEKMVHRGASLVKQLLTFARKTDVLLESVKVNDLIIELHKLLVETFPKTITFSLELAKNLPSIIGDRNQLHQALLNLCLNARDAMPKGGMLSLSSALVSGDELKKRFPDIQEGNFILVTIADTGMGMDETTKRRIFEPFFSTKERGKGTGLGLAVVYGIVQSHRGFINVRSAVGRGTAFELYFPVQMEEVIITESEQKSIETIEGGTETILLVEDEEMLLEFVRQLLEGKGYKTIVARDGEEAVTQYQLYRDEISLVLTDVGLPKMSGLEEFLELKAINPGVKVIFASGYIDPHLRSEMQKHAAKDFIQKPYNPEEVLKKIREVLDGK